MNSGARANPHFLHSAFLTLTDGLFKPVSPLPMCVFRILVGLIVLQKLLVMLLPDFSLYFGNHSLIANSDVLIYWWRQTPYFDLMQLFANSESMKLGFFILTVVAAAFMTVGLFTRPSAWMLYFALLSFDNRFGFNQNGADIYLRLAVMMLALSRCGDMLSIDSKIRRTPVPTTSAPWAQRFMQLQMSLVYLHTVGCKLIGPAWQNGSACYYASRYEDMMRFPVPFLFESLICLKTLTWATLVVELSCGTLIWMKRCRYAVIAAGLGLHLSIDWSMNLPMFEWLLISTYVLFIDPAVIRNFINRILAVIGQNQMNEPITSEDVSNVRTDAVGPASGRGRRGSFTSAALILFLTAAFVIVLLIPYAERSRLQNERTARALQFGPAALAGRLERRLDSYHDRYQDHAHGQKPESEHEHENEINDRISLAEVDRCLQRFDDARSELSAALAGVDENPNEATRKQQNRKILMLLAEQDRDEEKYSASEEKLASLDRGDNAVSTNLAVDLYLQGLSEQNVTARKSLFVRSLECFDLALEHSDNNQAEVERSRNLVQRDLTELNDLH